MRRNQDRNYTTPTTRYPEIARQPRQGSGPRIFRSVTAHSNGERLESTRTSLCFPLAGSKSSGRGEIKTRRRRQSLSVVKTLACVFLSVVRKNDRHLELYLQTIFPFFRLEDKNDPFPPRCSNHQIEGIYTHSQSFQIDRRTRKIVLSTDSQGPSRRLQKNYVTRKMI